MKEEDIKVFLDDFKKAKIEQKMDMWFYALDQEAIWDEIMDEMSKIARIQLMKSGVKISAEEE
jgi:D-alanine-D-alanine ligase-like ATP-grasp enzyme